jgi:outer membrane receptor protein involved in Fe transport
LNHRRTGGRIIRATAFAAAVAWCLVFFAAAIEAGTTGKLSGRIVDADGQPVFGVNVLIVGTKMGANTDLDGYFSVINIPAGTYGVRLSHVAYKQMIFSNVVISADQTRKLDAELESSTVSMETVEVRAERPVVDVNLTSMRATVTAEEIAALPLQELQDVVNLQAGVVDGHIRGGRLGEVQYQVDGVSVNNAFDNKSTLKIDRSLLQEVQVISGVFDAEYGQAMSGVVNAVLKDGTEDFHWSAEFFGGGFVFPDGNNRLVDDQVLPASIGSAQLSLSGPTGLPETVLLLNARGYRFDDYVQAERRFVSGDRSDFEHLVFYPSGGGEKEPLGYSTEYSGLLKLTNKSVPNVGVCYQAIFNTIHGRRINWAYRLNPDGLTKQTTYSVDHGVDWTHTLSASTYYKVSVRQNYHEYWDRLYDSLWDPRYDFNGPAIGHENYELGAYVQGVDFTRYVQRTNEVLAVGSFVSQVNRFHLVKFGGEYHLPRIEFGRLGYLVNSTGQLVRHRDEPPDYPGPKQYKPVIAAAYAQDQIEWRDLTVRAGLRLDYFAARDSLPSDLSNPANSIPPPAPASRFVATEAKVRLAPRLGMAIPISESAGLHFAYGHFYQFPAIGTIFANADYRILFDYAASSVDPGVLGNPDIKPEKTVQYEMGYKHAITPDLGMDLNLFYKDIRDLLGVEFISTYNDAQYARLTNVDFGDVVGFTLAMNHRKLGPVSASMDYTWQHAEGNSSNPDETWTRAQAGEDPRPRLVPLNWDQRHTLNATLSTVLLRDISASFILRLASGQPYTPVTEVTFGHGLETNSGRKPVSTSMDLRAEKNFACGDYNIGLFGRVFNVFDTRFFNGRVYDSTGSPYYSRSRSDRFALADPTQFYAPRRIEIGIKLEPGS